MPLRITTVEGRRTVVCEPVLPAIGVLPPQKWRPSHHAALLQAALLRAASQAVRQSAHQHDEAVKTSSPEALVDATGPRYWISDATPAAARG
jgi:hypothetical protein